MVHALTREHGRVHLAARGAYRMTSRYFAVLDLFDELELEWDHSPRRELQNLRAGSIATRRRTMRRSLPAWRAGVTVLELSDLAARHDRSDTGLFALAQGALGALEIAAESPATTLVRFELAFLHHLGLAPALSTCAACGGPAPPVIRKPEERAAFSAGAGGRLCRRCAEEARAAGRRVGTLPVRVLEDARRLADADGRISAMPAGARPPLDTAMIEEERITRVRDFIGRFLDYHLETRPRSQRAFLATPNRNAASARQKSPRPTP